MNRGLFTVVNYSTVTECFTTVNNVNTGKVINIILVFSYETYIQ